MIGDSENNAYISFLATEVFKEFTDVCGGSYSEFSVILHSRFTVNDPRYKDYDVFRRVIRYFNETVIPHKIAVFRAGKQLLSNPQMSFVLTDPEKEVFLKNLWWHDLSKFSANEALGYALHNFTEPQKGTLHDFKKAWHHHKMNNPHHPEYWLNPDRMGKAEPITMPPIYLVEMLADWIGAGQTYGSTLQQWLPSNLHKFNFGPSTIQLVKKMLYDLLGINTIYSVAEWQDIPQKNVEVLKVDNEQSV